MGEAPLLQLSTTEVTTTTTTTPATTTIYMSEKLPTRASWKIMRNFRLSNEQTLMLIIWAASLGSFCSGLFVGWSSHANAALVTKYTTWNVSRIHSYLALGAAVGPLVAHSLWPRIGTKAVVIGSSLVMCTSIIGLYVDYGIVALLIARFASGLAIGIIQLLVPAYVQDFVKCVTVNATTSSLSPSIKLPPTSSASSSTSSSSSASWTAAHPKYATHAMLTFANDVFHLQFVLGVLTLFVTGLFEQSLPHLACIVMVAATVALTIVVCLLPESPRFLCQRKRSDCSGSGAAAARQMLQQFTVSMDSTNGAGPETCNQRKSDAADGAEAFLQLWSRPEAESEYGLRALLYMESDDGVLKGLLRSRSLLKAILAVVLAQWLGLTAALFYMEKLLALAFNAVNTPPIDAVLCVACVAIAAALPLCKQFTGYRRHIVPFISACAVALFLFGLHCHYHGTFGSYTMPETAVVRTPSAAGLSNSQRSQLPVLLFGTAFALYGLSAMRLSGAETLAGSMVWRCNNRRVAADDGRELSARTIMLSVQWLVVFCSARVMLALVNFIGLGWLLWFMMANTIVLAVQLRWWLRNGTDADAADEAETEAVNQCKRADDGVGELQRVLVMSEKTASRA